MVGQQNLRRLLRINERVCLVRQVAIHQTTGGGVSNQRNDGTMGYDVSGSQSLDLHQRLHWQMHLDNRNCREDSAEDVG